MQPIENIHSINSEDNNKFKYLKILVYNLFSMLNGVFSYGIDLYTATSLVIVTYITTYLILIFKNKQNTDKKRLSLYCY